MSDFLIVENNEELSSIQRVVGENGTLAFSEESMQGLLGLFFSLVRNCSRVDEFIVRCIGDANQSASKEEAGNLIADLFVLTFQTRDCRGGKGERALFYQLIHSLYTYYPISTLSILPYLHEYGYYKDFFGLMVMFGPEELIVQRLLDLFVNQLLTDEAKYDQYQAQMLEENETKPVLSMSLCAKYAPREGKSFEKKHSELFQLLLNKLQMNHETYRKLITKLSNALDITEIKMCGKHFRDIDFHKVPSVCAKRNGKAFLNEKIKKPPAAFPELETGNRYPEDEDRVLCRKHFKESISQGKIKGGLLYPHELIKQFMGNKSKNCSEEVVALAQCQWNDMKQKIIQSIQEKASASASSEGSLPINLGKLVPLVDVSGSMSGIPMEVAMALGILISELNHPAFRDRFISFESRPQWVDLSSCANIKEKVQVAQFSPWGGSTNLELAFELIIQVIRSHRIPMSEIPAMIIFSDMQFDCAFEGGHLTQLERIQQRFAALGMELEGVPYPAPTIIFWNLRDADKGYPAEPDSHNVQLLAGYSPSLFKFICSGEMTAEKSKPDPFDTLRKVLDDPRYDMIRKCLSQSQEKHLIHYQFLGRSVNDNDENKEKVDV